MCRKTVTFLLSSMFVLFSNSSCSWVNDDQSDCPTGFWLKLEYTYNMLDVDAASTQVKDATLFVLDKDSNIVKREDVDSITLHNNGCMIQVDGLPEDDYSFLLWAGITDTLYMYEPSSLSLKRNLSGEQSRRLSSLFYGRLNDIHLTDEYQVHTVSLVKDTKVFSCVLQCQDDMPLEPEYFRLEIISCNGLMNHYNMPIDTVAVHYLPFTQNTVEIEDMQVVSTGLNTLRLMSDDSTRLRLTYTPTEEALLDIPLTPYLLLSRDIEAAGMESQEYLDRQDSYTLVFFLVPTGNTERPYMCMQMMVNGWIVRINDAVLSKSEQ